MKSGLISMGVRGSNPGGNPPPEGFIQVSEGLKRSAKGGGNPVSSTFPDDGMTRIWLELLTKAALYAGAIGLVAGMAAAVFSGS